MITAYQIKLIIKPRQNQIIIILPGLYSSSCSSSELLSSINDSVSVRDSEREVDLILAVLLLLRLVLVLFVLV